MAEYLIELYLPRTDALVAIERGESARAAAEEMTRQGTAVQFRRSIFVPDDETYFVLFEAESADAVRETARRAQLPCERVSVAVSQSWGETQ
jgi:hypothetical protein